MTVATGGSGAEGEGRLVGAAGGCGDNGGWEGSSGWGRNVDRTGSVRWRGGGVKWGSEC